MGAPLRKLTVALATAAVAALGAAVLVQVHRHGSEAVGGRSAAAAWLQLAAALATWAAGLDLALRGRARLSGALLAAAGPALPRGAGPPPSAGGALLFTAALLGGAGAAPLAGSAGLLHPAPARRLDVVVAGAAVAGAIVVLGLVATAAFDPRAAGCFDCPRNLLLVHGDVAFHDTLIRDGLWAQAALCAALAALTLVRWASRPGLVRAAVAPVAAGGAIASTLGAASFAHAAHLGAPQADDTAQTLWLALSVV